MAILRWIRFSKSEIHDLIASFPISKHISGCEPHLIFSSYEMRGSGIDHNTSTRQSWKKPSVKWLFSDESCWCLAQSGRLLREALWKTEREQAGLCRKAPRQQGRYEREERDHTLGRIAVQASKSQNFEEDNPSKATSTRNGQSPEPHVQSQAGEKNLCDMVWVLQVSWKAFSL